MQPSTSTAVRASVAVAVLAAAISLLESRTEPALYRAAPAAREPAPSPSTRAPCPSGTLPDDGLCLPVPSPAAADSVARPDEATGIELLPERPTSYSAYKLPVAVESFEAASSSVFLRTQEQAEVEVVELEGQEGPAERLLDGGPSTRVLTLHTLRRAGAVRRYLVVLEPVQLTLGRAQLLLPAGSKLGQVASAPGLRLSVRQLRQGTDPRSTTPERLLLDDSSIPCDPRNVLARRT